MANGIACHMLVCVFAW